MKVSCTLPPSSNKNTHMDLEKIQHLCREFLQAEPRLSTDFGPSWSLGVARARFRLILEEVENAQA